MTKPKSLKYSYNWSEKLLCPIHTTIRLWNPAVYRKGMIFDEYLKNVFMGTVQVIDVKRIKLIQVNDYIAGLDTGYLAAACQEMIKEMYKNRVNDWNQQDLAFVLLRKIKK